MVHLTLRLRSQVSAPANDPAVLPPSTEQSAALQGAQCKHAAVMRSGLSHDLEGLCHKDKIEKCSKYEQETKLQNNFMAATGNHQIQFINIVRN